MSASSSSSTLRKRNVTKEEEKSSSSSSSSGGGGTTTMMSTRRGNLGDPKGPTAEYAAEYATLLRRPNPRISPSSHAEKEHSKSSFALLNASSQSFSGKKGAYPKSNDNELCCIDLHFRYVSIFAVACYVFLVCFSYYVTPSHHIQYLSGYEKSAPLLAFLILVVSCTTHVLPLFYRRSTRSNSSRRETRSSSSSSSTLSGVLIGAITVQIIACITDAIMAFGPTPILIDPVLGTRVHLLRWCEWTPLAFVMTFLTEGCGTHRHHIFDSPEDDDDDKKSKNKIRDVLFPAYMHASCQGLSTLCGLFFPLCTGKISWWILMIVSCALFLVIYPRCRSQWRVFQKIEQQMNTRQYTKNDELDQQQQKHQKHTSSTWTPTVDEMEFYDRARLSFRLLITCAFMWSLLVFSYFLSGFSAIIIRNYFPTLASPDSIWLDQSLTMISECTMDVISKVLYLHIIVDVHEAVFDEGIKAERRLEELRKMMSVVWENSSDVIGISVRGGIRGDVTTMLSPTFMHIYNQSSSSSSADGKRQGEEINNNDDDSRQKALVFELDAKCFKKAKEQQQQKQQQWDNTMLNQFFNADPSSGMDVEPPIAPLSVYPRAVYNTEFCSLSSLNKNNRYQHTTNKHNKKSRSLSTTKITKDSSSQVNNGGYRTIQEEEISSMADLVVRAWTHEGDSETLLMHDLIRRKEMQQQQNSNIRRRPSFSPMLDENEEEEAAAAAAEEEVQFDTIRCEAKINRLEENALVIVVRDISERFRRFEAEKKVVFETTAREKDAEANRFTRHEVKNGLLAAIGLCEGLKETMPPGNGVGGTVGTIGNNVGVVSDVSSSATTGVGVGTASSISLASPNQFLPLSTMLDTSSRLISELDKTLREVLDTILAEAMARDVIHEVYEPRLERVDICELLCGVFATQEFRDGVISSNSSVSSDAMYKPSERFPLIAHPSPLPHFAFDPQLLRYIHRNAVSNACKYGQRGGVVLTEVRYDENKRMLHMEVINLPGEYHEAIRAMGDAVAGDIVFSPGQRLHRFFEQKQGRRQIGGTEISHSSGDGAWIMRKCAKTLGGDCSIRFEPHRTVFGLQFPAVPFDVSLREKSAPDPTQFRLPPNIWGVAIDDSKIQRKLMERYFSLVGIKQDRIIILGKDADEINGFVDYAVDFIEQHQKIEHDDHYFLIIADENLDIMEDETHHVTISGSMCVESIRKRLLPEQERRVCALIRSANDSSQDVAIYNSRAHGFLPKVPIKRNQVMETLAPLWEQRFPPYHSVGSSSSSVDSSSTSGLKLGDGRGEVAIAGESEADASSPAAASATLLLDDPKASNKNDNHNQGHNEDDEISLTDLMQTINEIDALCTVEDAKYGGKKPPRKLWPLVWEKLHSLKGDLQTMYDSAPIVDLINSIREPVLPDNFVECWKSIRALVVAMR